MNIPCPLKVTWDAALQIRETVKRHMNRKAFVVAVLIFPDMKPDPDIELRAENDRVKVLLSRVNYICRLASISFAGSPPWPGPVAGQRWSGSWGRQTPG